MKFDGASIIVCTHNRAGQLKRTLHSLARQRPSGVTLEIIIIDDGSDDDTPQTCKDFQANNPALLFRYVRNNACIGLSPSRNRAVGIARGEFLLFTDDDCIAAFDWAQRMIDALRNHSIVAGAVDTPVNDYFKLCHNVAQFYRFMPGRPSGEVDFVAGANMGFRRQVLESLGGFQKAKRHADDMELVLRARERGWRPWFEPEAIVCHDPERASLAKLWRYSAVHAATTVQLRRRYSDLLKTPWVLRHPLTLRLLAPVIAARVTLKIYWGAGREKRLLTAPVVYALKTAWCFGAARGLGQSSLEYIQ